MTAPRWDDPGPVVPRSSQSLSYSPVLRVDPGRVEGMVGRLEGVISRLVELENQLDPVFVAPPGQDPVSRNVATQAVSMVEAARIFLSSWRGQLVDSAEALLAQGQGYQSVDQAFS